MKRASIIFLTVFAVISLSLLFSAEFSYVGAGKCKMCHKSEKKGQQYPLWQERKHSKSFDALSTEEAQKIAADAGVTCPPAESPDCLKCHAPLYEKAPEFKAEGVTCEVCHGPGSDYKKMSVMKDHAESVAKGMIEYQSADDIKAQCLPCHEKAHNKVFDFEAAWEKVKHPKPEEKE